MAAVDPGDPTVTGLEHAQVAERHVSVVYGQATVAGNQRAVAWLEVAAQALGRAKLHLSAPPAPPPAPGDPDPVEDGFRPTPAPGAVTGTPPAPSLDLGAMLGRGL